LTTAPGDDEEIVGYLGLAPKPEFEKEGLIGGVADAGSRTWQVSKLSVVGIKDMFTMVFGGELWDALSGEGERQVDEGPLGIVGASRIASESVDAGRSLDLIALIVGFTVFVGLMNLLPLPPLDGGHLAVLAWEKVTGKAVDVRKLIPIAAAVISFFVILFVAVLYLDLARPIANPF
jgi:membrane-associated protease RseP (regulator of RpoE activity)